MAISGLCEKTTIHENKTQSPASSISLVIMSSAKATELFREMAGAGCGELVAESGLGEKTTIHENKTQSPTSDNSLFVDINTKASQLFREMAGAGCGELVAEEPILKALETKL